MNVCGVDLPIVPVEESQAETTTAASDVPAVTQKPAEQETPVITEAPATTKAAQTARASVSEKSTTRSDATISDLPASENTDSEINELPVLSPDGESTAETSESSSESSISDDKDSSDTQITANTDSKDITEASKESVLLALRKNLCKIENCDKSDITGATVKSRSNFLQYTTDTVICQDSRRLSRACRDT